MAEGAFQNSDLEKTGISTLIEMLQQKLGSEGLSMQGCRIGADPQSTGNAVEAALPALVGALSRKGADTNGASGLMQMLDRDGDGNVLDDLQGFLGGNRAETGAGQNMLQQLLGGQQQRVEQGVAKASGLDAGAAQKLLGMLAPMVMGALAKEKQGKGLDAGGLMGFLGNENKSVEKKTGGMIGRLLDQNCDGDFDLNDMAKLAVGKLFGKK